MLPTKTKATILATVIAISSGLGFAFNSILHSFNTNITIKKGTGIGAVFSNVKTLKK